MIASVEIFLPEALILNFLAIAIVSLPPVLKCVCYSLCGEGISLVLDKVSSVIGC